MKYLFKYLGTTFLLILLWMNSSLAGALDGKGIFCIGPDPNFYGYNSAWKFVNGSVEKYEFIAKSDQIFFEKSKFDYTEYYLSPSEVWWLLKDDTFTLRLDRKSLKLRSGQTVFGYCRVMDNMSEFKAEAERLTRKFQTIYDESAKGNKL